MINFINIPFRIVTILLWAYSISPNALAQVFDAGGLIRANIDQPTIYLTFTGGDYNDGRNAIYKTLKSTGVLAQFFFTGDFYRNKENKRFIKRLKKSGHYLGPHSDKHLLYADWNDRNQLLVNQSEFSKDLLNNYEAMQLFGIAKKDAIYFMPPYEWYNQRITDWCNEMNVRLINFTPGSYSNADYTTPDMNDRYRSSQFIMDRILAYEQSDPNGLNGFILLLHVGTHPDRTDKFYFRLAELIDVLKKRGYRFGLIQDTDYSFK